MKGFFSFILYFLMFPAAFAQTTTPLVELLKEAENNLYSQPEQSGKISEYIIGQGENTIIKAEARLLLAKSFYVRGNYNEASKNALQAKSLADASHENELKIRATIFCIQLLRELGLDTLAEKYSAELDGFSEEILNEYFSNWFQGKLFQDKAFVKFRQNDFPKATKLLNGAQTLFMENGDSVSVFETELSLAEIYLKNSRPDSAAILLKNLHANATNDFQKMQVFSEFGNFYFLQKEHLQAVKAFQQAVELSLKLRNKNFENKSLEGLAVNYLALEDTQNFLSYKQKANATATEVEMDRNLAVNTVYNFTNTNQKELSKNKIQSAFLWVYILGSLLVLLFVIGSFINYLYISKTREYLAIYKYIAPAKIPEKSSTEIEKLEKSSIVPEETEQQLLHKLDRFEAGKKFTNPDMSIALLAAQFDTNTKYLSEVINRHKGKNFNSYINELRINYIIEKLRTESVYFNYKVSYLAKESGFSSHSSFATVFKSVTGISPTKFMDFLQKRETA